MITQILLYIAQHGVVYKIDWGKTALQDQDFRQFIKDLS